VIGHESVGKTLAREAISDEFISLILSNIIFAVASARMKPFKDALNQHVLMVWLRPAGVEQFSLIREST